MSALGPNGHAGVDEWFAFGGRRGSLKISRIGQGSARPRPCSVRYMRRLNAVVTENMEHRLAIEDQIIRYDPTMAPPPYRLCAHNRAPRSVTKIAKRIQSKMKALAQGIIGIVMKALVLPKGIHDFWYVALASAPASKRRDVRISNLEFG